MRQSCLRYNAVRTMNVTAHSLCESPNSRMAVAIVVAVAVVLHARLCKHASDSSKAPVNKQLRREKPWQNVYTN